MTHTDLKQKIKLILSQVRASASIYTIRNLSLLGARLADAFLQERDRAGEILIADAGDVEVTNEQVVLLKTLYAQCTREHQGRFSSHLFGEITERNTRVVVHTILEIGGPRGLKQVLDDSEKLGLPVRRAVWSAIHEKLKMESHRFTDEDLTLLEEMRAIEVSRIPEPPPRPRGIRGIGR